MAKKKTVLKICVVCVKCRICYMKTAAKFPGVTSLALDLEKSTLTVVGEVDPVAIVQELKKVRKAAEILTVGSPDKKKEDEKKCCLPACCYSCKRYPAVVVEESPPGACTIM